MKMTEKTDTKFQLKTNELNFMEINKRLQTEGVVFFPFILEPELLEQLEREADELLSMYGKRVSLQVPSTGNTPRNT
jgi:hypothetical protein